MLWLVVKNTKEGKSFLSSLMYRNGWAHEGNKLPFHVGNRCRFGLGRGSEQAPLFAVCVLRSSSPGWRVFHFLGLLSGQINNRLHFRGKKKDNVGTSLVVQWLRLCTPIAEGTGSIPGQGTKIPHGVAKKKIMSAIDDTKLDPRRQGLSPMQCKYASYLRRWLSWGITREASFSHYWIMMLQQSEAVSSSFFIFDLTQFSLFQFLPWELFYFFRLCALPKPKHFSI